MNHDFANWKIRYLIEDPQDINMLKQMIKDNFSQLKEVRMGSIAQSGDPPRLSRHEYLKVCQMAKIVDETFSLKKLDKIFRVTFDDSDDEDCKSEEKALIRFEFFEILARIAHAKYVLTG